MTPLLNPLTASEKKYQKSQIGTRNIIERVFGILKRRFPALALGIRTKLTTTMAIIVAAAVLHNILRIHNDPMPQDDSDEINPEIFHELPVLPARQVGNVYRTHLINTIFSSDD
uniref:DDE Tnp4 domain-containing protein n=1 Tax=Schizaphis graminum TaxID=13262 RepID=A0A2S2NJD8_SCHGA